MAKGTQAQSRQSSAIHLVQEDGTPTILNLDLATEGKHLVLKRFPGETSPAASRSNSSRPRTTLSAATVLRELFELLEDYAPAWYTEENHNRAVAALAQTTVQ